MRMWAEETGSFRRPVRKERTQRPGDTVQGNTAADGSVCRHFLIQQKRKPPRIQAADRGFR